METTANHYTAELSTELASRFLLIAGVGMPARRATCLLELQQHVIKVFGNGAPKRTEQINKALYGLVWDWYHVSSDTGQPIRRLSTLR